MQQTCSGPSRQRMLTCCALPARAARGAVLWHKSFLGDRAVVSADVGCYSLQPQIGIVSTPVIDLPSNTLYADVLRIESGVIVHRWGWLRGKRCLFGGLLGDTATALFLRALHCTLHERRRTCQTAGR